MGKDTIGDKLMFNFINGKHYPNKSSYMKQTNNKNKYSLVIHAKI